MSASPPTPERTIPRWRAFDLGGLPHQDVHAAWQAVLGHFPSMPTWPQLSRRSALESMYAQYSERFPGISIREERVVVDRLREIGSELDQLYLAYLEDDPVYGRIGPDYSASLDVLLRGEVTFVQAPVAMVGQITGPVSWGLGLVDHNDRPVLHDDVLVHAVGKHLHMKALWQERELGRFAPQTLMIIHEPRLCSIESSALTLAPGQIRELLGEVISGLTGLRAIHCCGSPDWSILLDLPLDVLCLDAYDCPDSIAQYPRQVGNFLARGGSLAWGIVPAGEEALEESVPSLVDRLHDAMGRLADAGVPRQAIETAGLVTPACSLAHLSPALAEHILGLTRGVSQEMRRLHDVSDEGSPQVDDSSRAGPESM